MVTAHHSVKASSALARRARSGLERALVATRSRDGLPASRLTAPLAGPSPASSELKAGPDVGHAGAARGGGGLGCARPALDGLAVGPGLTDEGLGTGAARG